MMESIESLDKIIRTGYEIDESGEKSFIFFRTSLHTSFLFCRLNQWKSYVEIK